jgi:hypothetical protein
MIDGYEFFEVYTAVNLHFTSKSYDYFRYNGDTSISEKSYLKRRDKYFFENHAARLKEISPIAYCVSNFASGKKYIKDFDVKTYQNWMEKFNRMGYTFKEEMINYLRAKKNYKGDKLDLLVDLLHANAVSPEFVILFNTIMGGEIFKELDTHVNNFLWHSHVKNNLTRYAPFIIYLWNIDKSKLDLLRSAAFNAQEAA